MSREEASSVTNEVANLLCCTDSAAKAAGSIDAKRSEIWGRKFEVDGFSPTPSPMTAATV
jgi:hypothetical protein